MVSQWLLNLTGNRCLAKSRLDILYRRRLVRQPEVRGKVGNRVGQTGIIDLPIPHLPGEMELDRLIRLPRNADTERRPRRKAIELTEITCQVRRQSGSQGGRDIQLNLLAGKTPLAHRGHNDSVERGAVQVITRKRSRQFQYAELLLAALVPTGAMFALISRKVYSRVGA